MNHDGASVGLCAECFYDICHARNKFSLLAHEETTVVLDWCEDIGGSPADIQLQGLDPSLK